jgi:hypothetical protein
MDHWRNKGRAADAKTAVYGAFDLLRDLNYEFNSMRSISKDFGDAKFQQRVATKIADYQRLIALVERCFIQPFSPQTTAKIIDIVRQLLMMPTKGIYLTIPGQFTSIADNRAPTFAVFEEYSNFDFDIDKTDIEVLFECMKSEFPALTASFGLRLPDWSWLDRPEPDMPLTLANHRRILREKIQLMVWQLDGFNKAVEKQDNRDAAWSALRAVRRRIEECLWPKPIQRMPSLATIGSASAAAAAPMPDMKQNFNPNLNYGAAGISIEPATMSANYHAADYSEFGRPIKPKGAMTPAKPTVLKKQGGGLIGFRPTVVRCFF